MSLAMKARQKVKRKGAPKDRVFGCDLVEHLQSSSQEVPQVLKSCTEFVEQHGVVDGIYRLSGVSSNAQKLRLEFDSDRNPDLNKEVYLQDVHCVSSLCKAYFRELPNPLLTYQLYDKFAEAVAIQLEEGRLEKIKEVLKELPSPHYRTLEFLMKHLVHMASFSSQTNMHVRNLAIVWAPNLLRSKDIEVSGFNGTAAFMEVRIQSIVVEFILTHVEQIFGNAPLSGGLRQSIRRSLLASQAGLSEEKFCSPYTVPVVPGPGDGPPQTQPYHTIIEFNDNKRKGSLKGKRWKSIFNLGRSSHDSKRKLNKPEEKDQKAGKTRLRPAKSMDSLSSMPSASDDGAQLGRQTSQRKLTSCRESLEGPASLDSSFLESGYVSAQSKSEDLPDETVKSEPTTPKSGRSSLLGGTPHGRSPKTGRSRAERCAGVHISGPLSVTVPFHITSNLTLSRLTRGLQCPALSHCPFGNEGPEAAPPRREESGRRKEEEGTPRPTVEAEKEEAEGANAEVEALDAEENRISMEVQASFSFLDSQDAWTGDGPEEDQPPRSSSGDNDSPPGGSEMLPGAEDDFGSGFLNEMIGDGMELAMYSTVPQLDYLSIEECMNEQSEGEDEQYYLAMGFTDEELPKEADAEEVYLSAFDDISPLANELEQIQQFTEDRTPDIHSPKLTVEDDASRMATGALPEDPESLHLLEAGVEHQKGEFSTSCDPGLTKYLDPEIVKPSQGESGVLRNSRNNSSEMERNLENKAEADKIEGPGFSLLQVKDTNLGNEVDVFIQTTECPEEAKCERPLDSELENQATALGLEDQLQLQNASTCEQTPGLPSSPEVEALPSGMVGKANQPLDGALVIQEMAELHGREATQTSSPLEDLTLLRGQIPSLLDSDSKNGSSISPPALPVWTPEHTSSEAAYANPPVLDSCMTSEDFSFTAPPPKSCLGLLQKPPCELASYALKHDLLDGSVHMKLTSNITRVQQAKSFPVVPPKPQFAKIPPSLKPVTPYKEALITWPNAAVPGKDSGIGTERGPNESTLHRPFHPIGLDTSYHSTDGTQTVEPIPGSSAPESNCSNVDALPKQRNSMPVSWEQFGRDCKSQDSLTPKPPHSPQDQPLSWSWSGAFGGGSFHPATCPLAGSLDKQNSSWRNDGKGNLSPKRSSEPFLPEKPTSLGSEALPPTQRWSKWRNSGSRSFDEAVALAKERHVAQDPTGRKPTGCGGDLEGQCGLPRTGKPALHPKSTLRPPSQLSHRPLGCLSTAAGPEAPDLGKPPFPPALPDITAEGTLPLGQKGLAFPHDFPPRKRPTLAKIGRRLSMSEEAYFTLTHEQR